MWSVSLLFLEIFWLCHVACETLVSQLGIESVTLALGAQSLNHWTAREVRASLLKALKNPGTRFTSYCWDSSNQPSQKHEESWRVTVHKDP